jgi:hypothetical protein
MRWKIVLVLGLALLLAATAPAGPSGLPAPAPWIDAVEGSVAMIGTSAGMRPGRRFAPEGWSADRERSGRIQRLQRRLQGRRGQSRS